MKRPRLMQWQSPLNLCPDEIDGPSLFDVGGTDHMDEGANIRGD